MAATMAFAVHTMSSSTTSQQPRAPLRRATYIHVSDLTSAYNIDHARLEQELARVKTERDAKTVVVKPENEVLDIVEDDSSGAPSLPQKRLQPPRGGYNLCV
jgi:hypothetical protein